MRQREDAYRHASPVEAKHAGRKPYQKPAVRHERVFEINALTCGKLGGTGSSCHYGKKNS